MFVEERHERGEQRQERNERPVPSPLTELDFIHPGETVVRTLAHREAAGGRAAERKGREGAALSAQAAEPLEEQGRGRKCQGSPGSATGWEEHGKGSGHVWVWMTLP